MQSFAIIAGWVPAKKGETFKEVETVMYQVRKQLRVTIVAFLLGALGQPAFAANAATTYPTHLVRIIVPFSAGSLTDLLARTLSDKLGAMWKQTVIVENRPGIPGTVDVANAPADGYTLLLISNGHTIIKAINPDVPFDPIKDFAGVSELATMPMIMIAPPKPDHDSLANLIHLAKANPGTLSYASAGLNSTAYIAGEYFKRPKALISSTSRTRVRRTRKRALCAGIPISSFHPQQ
jgi:tripartite-type tricarboxylate transporter receptor subunit TctC